VPAIVSEPLTSDDEFVILASDGLWDVLNAEEAVRLARSELAAYEDAQLAAEKLVEVALRRKTGDNVIVVVARLFAPRPEESMARQMRRTRSGMFSPRVADRTQSFVHLATSSTFVQVVGGFDGSA